jgi:predicted site-specific integrase-resolvase
MANAGYSAAALEMGKVETAARKLGLEVVKLEVRQAEDIAPIMAVLYARVSSDAQRKESAFGARRTH